MNGLEFTDVPVAEMDRAEVIKCAVGKRDCLKLSFNAEAYAKLGKPEALAVEAASRDGLHYLRLTPVSTGGGLARG